MKLIDAELLEKQMNKEVLHLFNSMYTGYVKAIKCVKQQPTAFDVDKVVEQLENYLFEKYCIEGDAIIDEIVKGGGEIERGEVDD